MSSSSSSGIGDSFFCDERFAEAHAAYSAALDSATSDATLLARRAATLIQLGRYEEAMADAIAALRVDPQSHIAAYRKGVAAFWLGEFEAAQGALRVAIDLAGARAPQLATLRKWLRRTDAELRAEAAEDGDEADADAAAAEEVPEVEEVDAIPAAAAQPVQRPVRRDFYQNPTHAMLSIFVKRATAEDVVVTFERRRLVVQLRRGLLGASAEEGGDPAALQTVMDTALGGSIDPSRSTYVVKSMKVELKMKKIASEMWSGLSAAKASVRPAASQASASMPRPYASQRDWDAIDADLKRQEEEEKPEGEEALNKLFKDIYAKATPETRRAMNKSMQTSGGTVLSTNWGEVAKKDYEKERTAPDGMEWKRWDGATDKEMGPPST